MDHDKTDLKDAKILLVDDQPANLDVLCELLQSKGYSVLVAPNGQIALQSAARAVPDVILLDVMMPDMDGFEVCRRLKQEDRTRDIPVIFITARDLQQDVITGFKVGGVDYITKPFKEEEVLIRVQTHVRMNWLWRELIKKNKELEAEIAQRKVLSGRLTAISQQEAQRWGLEGFVGRSAIMRQIFKDIRMMQENIATSVLITGETGAGKELIARAIHFGSTRNEGPFLPINCNAIPAELVESVLFGHVRGAFTGAETDRTGYFELAHEGTLFLDEVGDMPLELQGKLLRVLEDGEVWRVGATEATKVDVRVLAATNTDLQQKMQEGTFRRDLYFRLARFTVKAPPLRERREDIPLLARHFLKSFATEMGVDTPALSPQAIDRLTKYPFPGNVRELKNIIERALIQSRGGDIKPHHLHFVTEEHSNPTSPAPNLPMDLDEAAHWAQLRVVEQVMAGVDGNVSEVARILNTSRNKIYRIMGQEKE